MIPEGSKRLFRIEVRQRRLLHHLKLMDLEELDRQIGEFIRHVEHLVPRLRREAENKVRPDMNTPADGQRQVRS